MPKKPVKMYLHRGANGTVIFKTPKKKEDPYYGLPTHTLFLVPTKRKKVTQVLEVGAICNDADGINWKNSKLQRD